MTRFIAIDPSSTASGWAIFEGDALVAWGKIDASKIEYSSRFQFIIAGLNDLAERFRFRQIAIEETKYAWRGRNLSALRVAFVSIQKWAQGRKLAFFAYNVATWKNNVVGHVHASKETTMENVCFRFPGVPRDLSEHEYDAIAIGVGHAGFLARLELLRNNPGPFVDSLPRAERLALAKTGIEALVDEATGYEKVRPPDELRKRLRKHRGAK